MNGTRLCSRHKLHIELSSRPRDAHRPAEVGSHLEEALDIARAAGLKYVTQFENRQARLIPIN